MKTGVSVLTSFVLSWGFDTCGVWPGSNDPLPAAGSHPRPSSWEISLSSERELISSPMCGVEAQYSPIRSPTLVFSESVRPVSASSTLEHFLYFS